MADNSLQGGTDSIRDIDRSGVGTGPKTAVVQIDHAGAGAVAESLTSATNPLPSYRPDVTATGTIAAIAQNVALTITGSISSAAIQITGVWTGTLQFEGTVDGTTWVPINGVFAGTSTPSSSITTNGVVRLTPAGLTQIRINATAAITGTATISMRAGQGTGGTFLNQSLTAGANIIGKVGIDQTTPGTTNAVSITNASLAVTGPLTDAQLRASGVPVSLATDADTTSAGALAAAAQTVVLSTAGKSSASVQITGTWVGTITFEASADNQATWSSVNAVAATTSTPQPTTTVNGLYRLTPGGFSHIRANMTAFTSGSATVSMRGGLGGGTFANQILPSKITDGTSTVSIKAASTAAVAGDSPLVVTVHPSTFAQPVTGTFFQATQPVSLTSTTITGSVAVTGAFFQATQPVSLVSTTITGTSAVSLASLPALTAGAALIGDVNARQFASSADTTLQNAAVAVGNGTVLPATGYGTALIQITGTFAGTVTFEATEDGTNYFAISAVQAGTSTIATTATVPGIYRLVSVGLTNIRARISAYTSGSITALGRTTNAPFAGKVITLSSTSTVGLVAGVAAIGTVGVTSLPALVAGAAVIGAVTQSGTWNVGTITTLPALATGANVIGALKANQSVNVDQMNGVTVTMGSGVTGTGVQRVVLATDVALPVGANVIGGVTQSGTWNIGSITTLPALVAGAAIIGKVGIDQTTSGTTNLVVASQIVGVNSTTGDTGAKTVTGNGASQTNAGNKGVQILFALGTVTGTTPTFVGKVQGSVDGTTFFDLPGATTASLTATGNFGIMVYPGVATTAATTTTGTSATASMALPRTWRVVWTIGGTTPSFTITSVQYNYLAN